MKNMGSSWCWNALKNGKKISSIISWKDFPPWFFLGDWSILIIDCAQAESAIRDSEVSFQRSFGEAQGIFFEEHFGMMFFPPLWGWYSSWMGWLRIRFGFWIGLCDLVVWFNPDEFRRGSAFCGDRFIGDLTWLICLLLAFLDSFVLIPLISLFFFYGKEQARLLIGAFLTELLSANQLCDDRLLAVRLWQIHIHIWYICTSLCIQLSCLTKYMCIV